MSMQSSRPRSASSSRKGSDISETDAFAEDKAMNMLTKQAMKPQGFFRVGAPSCTGTKNTGRKNSFDTDSMVSDAWRGDTAAFKDFGAGKKQDERTLKARDDTLIPLLLNGMVPMEQIEKAYPAQTGCVRELIGLVPRCDQYLEIWPIAFKSYNLIVPNCFNVPFTQVRFGPGGSRQAADLQGCAMFAVSKAAECPYCTAHTCSFALRRGATPETLEQGWKAAGGAIGDAQDVVGDDVLEAEWRSTGGAVGEAERATFSVARCLGQVPCKLTERERGALIKSVGESTSELLVFSMCGMGYLNKIMDGLGVQLEQECYVETRDFIGSDMEVVKSKAGIMLDSKAPSSRPPKDTLWSRLRFVCKVPGAIRAELKVTKGVPNTWPAVGEHLRTTVGYDFPFLSALKSKSFPAKRVTLALATALIDNYDPKQSVVTVPIKVLAGAIFATVAKSYILAEQFQQLAAVFGVDPDVLQSARELGGLSPQGLDVEMLPSGLKHLDHSSQCLLLLARALAPTPAEVTEELVETLSAAKLPAECVIELVNFLAIAQLQLRLVTFYPHKIVPAGWMPPSNGVRMPAPQKYGQGGGSRPLDMTPPPQGVTGLKGSSPPLGVQSPPQGWVSPPQGGSPLQKSFLASTHGSMPPQMLPSGVIPTRITPRRASQSQQMWMHMSNNQPVPQYSPSQPPNNPQMPMNYALQQPQAPSIQPPPRSTGKQTDRSEASNSTLSSRATLRHDSQAPPPWALQVQDKAKREGAYVEWVEHPPVSWPPSPTASRAGTVGGWFGLPGNEYGVA